MATKKTPSKPRKTRKDPSGRLTDKDVRKGKRITRRTKK